MGGIVYRLRQKGENNYLVRHYYAGGYADLFEGSYDQALAVLNAFRDVEIAIDSLKLASEALNRLDNNLVARRLLRY